MSSFRIALRVGVTIVIAAMVMGLAVLVMARPGPGRPPGGSGDPVFEISGSVAPVYPLVDSTLALKVENPQQFSIIVTELDVIVGEASPACGADDLQVEPVDTPFEVPAEGESTVLTEVRLVDDAADACQTAVFPLDYAGRATRP